MGIWTEDLLQRSTKTKQELSITVYNCYEQITELTFHPYIVGLDVLRFEFAWGYLPELNNFYRFKIMDIKGFSLTGKKYNVRPEACYHYAKGEIHKAILEGFEKIYTDGDLQNK